MTTLICNVFFLIGATILPIEIGEMLFKGKVCARTFSQMLTSASIQIPYILIESLVLTGAYGLIAYARPGSIPVRWWCFELGVLRADVAYCREHRIAHDVGLLWTQHTVHHSSRDMNIVTNFRFGQFGDRA